jgi:hypothetical protein
VFRQDIVCLPKMRKVTVVVLLENASVEEQGTHRSAT